MPLNRCYIAVMLMVALLAIPWSPPCSATADPAIETRKRLLENQRNILRLRKEVETIEAELNIANTKWKNGDSSEALIEQIIDLNDCIEIGGIIIENISTVIWRQRLLLSTLERGSASSTLDLALTKAMNTNLSELARNLEGNSEARQEIAKMRSLLKEQAGLGKRYIETPDTVSYSAEQQLAEDEFLRLLELFSSDNDEKVDAKDIKITGMDGDTPYTHNEHLNYLGQGQFHMETVVHSGKMTFTVDHRPWHITIPAAEDHATYVVIYDTSPQEQPRLVLFNKALLLEY